MKTGLLIAAAFLALTNTACASASLKPLIHALDPVTDAEDRRQPQASALVSAISSTDWKLREKAATAYGRIQTSESVDPLLKLSKDEVAVVRAASAFALGQLGWIAEVAIPREEEILERLNEMTTDSSLNVRIEALKAIGKVGVAKTVELVQPHFGDSTPAVRSEAIMALTRSRIVMQRRETKYAELPQVTFDALIEHALDDDQIVRRNTAYFFARNADPRAEVSISKMIEDENVWVRVYAANALGKMKAKNSSAEIAKLLQDDVYNVRVAAIGPLLASGGKVANHPALASDSSHHVRALYAMNLDPKIEVEKQTLEGILKNDASVAVRTEALKVLARVQGANLEKWLRPFLEDSGWLMREAAVIASAPLAPAKRVAFLKLAMKDTNQNVRGSALEALGAIPTVQAFNVLESALGKETLIERGTVVTAFKERKEPKILSLIWNIYWKSEDRRWIETRQEMIDIIAKSVSKTTTGYLKRILAVDPDASVQSKARAALEARGEKNLPMPRELELSFSPYRENIPAENPKIRFETDRGTFVVEAFVDQAPIHVASLKGLVEAGKYDGLNWHRVVSNFVIQGGDPDGTGWGDSGYSLRAEINPIEFERGSLGMPRSTGFDTGGSQLFFMHQPTPHLDGQYTVFGRVIEGLDVIDR
ncbi:MAG: HEAT repeat domain-containing protein, partial [Bdellovibrionota bacterium]